MKPFIFFSQGDPLGIGLEVLIKAMASLANKGIWADHLLWVFQEDWKRTLASLSPKIKRFAEANICREQPFGPYECIRQVDHSPGSHASQALESAAKSALSFIAAHGAYSASLVTCPLNKNRTSQVAKFSGHTEYLQALAGSPNVWMLLQGPEMAVLLYSIHVPLTQVRVEETKLEEAIQVALREANGGKVWVLGLNPHAGDGGVIGQEEVEVITPLVSRLKKDWGDLLVGPLPADGAFANWRRLSVKQRPKIIVAMYHDQGLIPVKMWDSDRTVNQTLGLPFVRTSPDHGTAEDIFGLNIADHRSMEHAILVALNERPNHYPRGKGK